MSNLSTRILLSLLIVVAIATLAFSQTSPERQRKYPAPVEGDYTINNFNFRSGETLPELKLHY
jgi:homoserine O-acetyltransferase